MTEPATFTFRNLKIRALKWTGDNQYAVMRFVGDLESLLKEEDPVLALRYNYVREDRVKFKGGILSVLTHEGRKDIMIGDYILKIPFIGLDVKRKEIFEKMFKELNDEAQ